MQTMKCYLVMSGYYRTAFASDMLNKNNIPNEIVRAPADGSRRCSYAVKTDERFCSKSIQLLSMSNIVIDNTVIELV